MAVPKSRKSHSKTRMGRAHQGMTRPKTVYCSQCGAVNLPHRVCSQCGYYHGRVVVPEEAT